MLSDGGCCTKYLVHSPFFCLKYKNQASKNPVFVVKYIYATK